MRPLRHRLPRPLAPFAVAALLAAASPAQPEPVVRYRMEVVLDAAARLLRGTQVVTWRNATAGATDELRLHLYLNAFAGPGSTFMREAGAEFRAQWRPQDYGGCEIERFAIGSGDEVVDLTADLRFESPDDGNPSDRTVLVVPLPAPVPPGGAITWQATFTSRLPRALRRTGWVPDDGVFCMHWFPKPGVLLDGDGGSRWSCHQFHANPEFFADFASWDVTIDVPAGYVVGATGGDPAAVEDRGGRTRLTFRQDGVHDFAWVADPDFVRIDDVFGPVRAADDETGVAPAVAARAGVAVSSFDLPQTRVILLLQPEHEVQADRHLEAVRCAMRFFGLRFGPYPYPAITVVDPGRDVSGRTLGGGMEYPMLITCGTGLWPHRRQLRPEGVTVHEFGHQYWYGLSANDEVHESWLDEGLNSFSESRAQTLHYGPRVRPVQTSSYGLLTFAAAPVAPPPGTAALRLPRIPGLADRQRWLREELRFSGTLVPESPLLDLLRQLPTATFAREAAHRDHERDRRRFLDAGSIDALVRPGWQYLDRESYVTNSYTRPATLLWTLERVVGRDRFWHFLRQFHQRARFRHPTTAEFVTALGEVCGPAAAALFRSATDGHGVFDYGIVRVEPATAAGDDNVVVVRRRGSVLADVTVRLRFAGREAPELRTFAADETYPWKRFVLPFDEFGTLDEAWVDPPAGTPGSGERFEAGRGLIGAYPIDANLLDNAWCRQRDLRPALYRSLRLWLQSQAELSFAGWIGS